MINQFWILTGPESNRGLATWDRSVILGGPIICSRDPDHQRSGKRESDLSVEVVQRATPDFIWTWYSECLVHERALDLFQKSKLTGFEVKPAQVHFKGSKRSERYYELIVLGWGGVAPLSSGVKLIQDCEECGLKVYSAPDDPKLLVDDSSWDGSDFFMVWPMPRRIFVSTRVVDIIRKTNLAGAKLLRPSDLKFSLSHTLTPGPLSYWMPEKRAHELGDPLGIN